MLDHTQLDHAVRMQHKSYALLRWATTAIADSVIQFQTRHYAGTTLPDATEAWLRRHLNGLPREIDLREVDIPAVAAMFSTYLQNSFDLVPEPGLRLYSPDAHCFCPLCSWLIAAPHLKAKKLTPADKKRAAKLQRAALQSVAHEQGLGLTETSATQLLSTDRAGEDAALVAYGCDLFLRVRGTATGPAVLALWRRFAWNRFGSPKPRFKLTAGLILDAERRLLDAVQFSA